jgi:hypothetical protein
MPREISSDKRRSKKRYVDLQLLIAAVDIAYFMAKRSQPLTIAKLKQFCSMLPAWRVALNIKKAIPIEKKSVVLKDGIDGKRWFRESCVGMDKKNLGSRFKFWNARNGPRAFRPVIPFYDKVEVVQDYGMARLQISSKKAAADI